MTSSEQVVFLRGVNVGGRTLRTAQFASDLRKFGAVNLGAAGTFVVLDSPGETRLRAEVVRRLPFAAEVFIVDGDEVRRLLRAKPFGGSLPPAGVRRAATVLPGPLDRVVAPFDRPVGGPWEVRVLGSDGPVVFSLHRRVRPDRTLYSNEVVEREFKVPSTTRWWETIEQVGSILETGSGTRVGSSGTGPTTSPHPRASKKSPRSGHPR